MTEPKAKDTRKQDTRVNLSAVIATVAAKRGTDDTTKTGKAVRRYIRANDAKLRKDFNWPPDEKERADGNRYPPMTRETADALVSALTK